MAVVLIAVLISTYAISSFAPFVQGKAGAQIESMERAIEQGHSVLSNSVLVRSNSFASISVGGRLSFWQTATAITKDYPLTGVGLGNYHSVYFLYNLDDGWYSKFAHNHYLQTAAETGLIGLSLFLLFLGGYGRKVWSRRKEVTDKGLYYGLMAALLAFIMHIFIDFTWNMPAVVISFWVMLAMILVLGKDPNGTERSISLPPATSLLAVVAIVFFLIASVLQFTSSRIDERAFALEREGQFKESIELYNKASQLNPINSLNYVHLSYNHFMLNQQGEKEEKNFKQAFDYAEQAIQMTPYDGYINNWIARLYYIQGEQQLAEEFLTKAVIFGGYKMKYYGDLANFHLSFNETTKAQEVFEEALENKDKALFDVPTQGERERITSEIIHLHLGLAKVYEEQGDFLKAKGQLEELLNMDEEHPVAIELLKNYQASGKI